MSLSKEKVYQRKNQISQPLLLVVSSTLLATCNGAALAFEGIEDPLATQSLSLSPQIPTLLAQTTTVSVVPSTEPIAQFSPYAKVPIQVADFGIATTAPAMAAADGMGHGNEAGPDYH